MKSRSLLDRGALKSRLARGEVTFGTFIGAASTITAEVCAAAGVDWVLLDLEHGAGGEEQARGVIPAAASYAVPTVVRVESTELVDAAFLAAVMPGTIIVNCGRGGLMDLDAAAVALERRKLSGVGLDVFDPEPPEHHPVFDRADVVLSPHLMGLSIGATRATFAAAAQGVADVLEDGDPATVANPGWREHIAD